MLITERRQQQAIADLINGHETEISYDHLTPVYKALWRMVDDWLEDGLDYVEISQEFHRMKIFLEDREEYEGVSTQKLIDGMEIAMGLRPGQRNSYTSMAERGPELPEISWLLKGWIPKGWVTLLAASPGVGKSYLSLALIDMALKGQTLNGLPFEKGGKQNAVYVDAEGFISVHYQRGHRWNLDFSKFYAMERPRRKMIDLSDREIQDQLLDTIFDLDPFIVVVDSFSRVNKRGENTIEKTLGVLSFLDELCSTTGLALLLVHHLRKRPPGLSNMAVNLDDIRGTGDLTAVARSVLAMHALKTNNQGDPNGPRCLKQLKANLGPIPKPLAVDFQPMEADPDFAQLTFTELDDWQQAGYFDEPQNKTDACAAWLLDVLDGEQLSKMEIEAMGMALGFNPPTIRRARNNLNGKIIDTLGSRITGNKWTLETDQEADLET